MLLGISLVKPCQFSGVEYKESQARKELAKGSSEKPSETQLNYNMVTLFHGKTFFRR